MGLDTTHDCWHGPYGAFSRWRIHLHHLLTGDAEDEMNLNAAWTRGDYADQSIPINVLMNHSDCEGSIAVADCGPLADALEELLPRVTDPEGALPYNVPKTEEFIAGLRCAAKLGEDVEFH